MARELYTKIYNSKYFENRSAEDVLGAVKPPCKNCRDRVLGCHEVCDKFKEYKEEVKRYKKYIEECRPAKNNHW